MSRKCQFQEKAAKEVYLQLLGYSKIFAGESKAGNKGIEHRQVEEIVDAYVKPFKSKPSQHCRTEW